MTALMFVVKNERDCYDEGEKPVYTNIVLSLIAAGADVNAKDNVSTLSCQHSTRSV